VNLFQVPLANGSASGNQVTTPPSPYLSNILEPLKEAGKKGIRLVSGDGAV
jgi:hypothetical protein